MILLKASIHRILEIAGAWSGSNGARLYGLLLPAQDGARSGQTERTTLTSPFIALDGRSIAHEEERLVTFG